MKKWNQMFQFIFSAVILSVLLIDTNTATAGVRDGIEMCLKVIIPSLFPFFVITTYLNSILVGCKIPGIRYLTSWLRIPDGGASILLLGLTGGYPIGAKLINDLYETKEIDKQTAHILLGYCNNAGPSFIFGVSSVAFPSHIVPFTLWFIHIISAVITGLLLPKPNCKEIYVHQAARVSLAQAIRNSISACISVCGWVIVFKVLLSYLYTWFHTLMKSQFGILVTGFLELSNGCISAAQIPDPEIRFIFFTVFFACGGLCVLLQTVSVTSTLGTGLYIHGKIIQTGVSFLLACVCSKILFLSSQTSITMMIVMLLSVVAIAFTLRRVNNYGNRIENHV